MKTCTKCKNSQSNSNYYSSKLTKDKLQSQCKTCCRKTPEQNSKALRKWKLKNLYNMTEQQYIKMLQDQKNRCLICKQEDSDLCIDHSHITGTVRGLLCRKCNAGIGLLKEDIAILARAIEYLTK